MRVILNTDPRESGDDKAIPAIQVATTQPPRRCGMGTGLVPLST